MNTFGVMGGICEYCKRREAACHFVGLVDGREQSRIVCWACYQELVILELIYAKTHCRYCGKRPAVVINDVEEYTHDEPRIYLCDDCATEYRRVFAEESGGLLDEFCMGALFNQVLDARGKTDTYMRAWAAGAALQSA
jgi:protein-arginine kinase activator protein McsA